MYARFRHIVVEEARCAPTQEEVAAIERDLGAVLPESFRRFIDVANGGYIEYVIDVPVPGGGSEEMSFCSVFSTDLDRATYGTFLCELDLARRDAKTPPGVLPFARNGGDSVVYLDLSPEGAGRVVAFVHGLPAWTGLRGESSYVEIAMSFDEYVAKLRVDREAVLDGLENASALEPVEATEQYLDIGLPDWRSDRELAAAVEDARRRTADGRRSG